MRSPYVIVLKFFMLLSDAFFISRPGDIRKHYIIVLQR